MNRITASLSALGTAALLTAGGLFLAPDGAPAGTGTPPGTTVPVELVESKGPLRDGEVTTTIYSVVQRNGQATTGNSVHTSTKASFDASLPDGEYLIKTVIGRPTELFHVDDIDATSPVPAGSNCGDGTDCTWIVVHGGRWSLKVGGTQTHPTATFQFSRRSPAPTTTVPPTTTTTTPATQMGQTAAPQQMQTVTLELADETDGLRPDMPRVPGAVTLVHYTPEGTGATFVSAAVTGADGTATHVIPIGTYTVQLIAPAPYTLTRVAPAGPHGPHGDIEELHLYLVVRPTDPPAPSGSAATTTDRDTTTVAPAAPQPEPTPEPAPQPEPEPEPTPEPAPQPEPEPEPQPEPTPSMGCDTSGDPEVQALLWTADGAIRWLVDGELMTLWPEPGMQPVRVCEDAYHRLTELGIDVDFYDAF